MFRKPTAKQFFLQGAFSAIKNDTARNLSYGVAVGWVGYSFYRLLKSYRDLVIL